MKRLLLITLLSVYGTSAWAIAWDKDMVDQPSEKAQESEAPPEPHATPVGGDEIVPAPANEAETFAGKDAAIGIPNPVAANADSIDRGREFYVVNCQICHGAQGKGDGPIAQKFEGNKPVDLTLNYTQQQTDGQLFYTITRGRVAMPFYRDALRPEERWDVINFMRAEFSGQ